MKKKIVVLFIYLFHVSVLYQTANIHQCFRIFISFVVHGIRKILRTLPPSTAIMSDPSPALSRPALSSHRPHLYLYTIVSFSHTFLLDIVNECLFYIFYYYPFPASSLLYICFFFKCFFFILFFFSRTNISVTDFDETSISVEGS